MDKAASAVLGRIAVHRVCCDKCGVKPLLGTRYHKRAEDFDLCEEDFSNLKAADQALYDEIAWPSDEQRILAEGCEALLAAENSAAEDADGCSDDELRAILAEPITLAMLKKLAKLAKLRQLKAHNEEIAVYGDNALRLAMQMKSADFSMAAHSFMGRVHWSLGRHTSALECFAGALSIARERHDDDAEAWACEMSAGVLCTLGQFVEALAKDGSQLLYEARISPMK